MLPISGGAIIEFFDLTNNKARLDLLLRPDRLFKTAVKIKYTDLSFRTTGPAEARLAFVCKGSGRSKASLVVSVPRGFVSKEKNKETRKVRAGLRKAKRKGRFKIDRLSAVEIIVVVDPHYPNLMDSVVVAPVWAVKSPSSEQQATAWAVELREFPELCGLNLFEVSDETKLEDNCIQALKTVASRYPLLTGCKVIGSSRSPKISGFADENKWRCFGTESPLFFHK
jgi:hypothetical protein